MGSQRHGPIESVILPLVLLRPFGCQRSDARHYGLLFRKCATAGPAEGAEASPQNKSNSGCAK
jgi:hypothetical protein